MSLMDDKISELVTDFLQIFQIKMGFGCSLGFQQFFFLNIFF